MVNRITGIGAPAAASRAQPAAKAGAAFNIAGNAPCAAAEEAQPAAAVSVAGMLALQEAESEAAQDKSARRHGLAMLNALCALQQALLSPHPDIEPEIGALARLAADIPQAASPGLSDLLAPIRLRAKIELLRRGIQIP